MSTSPPSTTAPALRSSGAGPRPPFAPSSSGDPGDSAGFNGQLNDALGTDRSPAPAPPPVGRGATASAGRPAAATDGASGSLRPHAPSRHGAGTSPSVPSRGGDTPTPSAAASSSQGPGAASGGSAAVPGGTSPTVARASVDAAAPDGAASVLPGAAVAIASPAAQTAVPDVAGAPSDEADADASDRTDEAPAGPDASPIPAAVLSHNPAATNLAALPPAVATLPPPSPGAGNASGSAGAPASESAPAVTAAAGRAERRANAIKPSGTTEADADGSLRAKSAATSAFPQPGGPAGAAAQQARANTSAAGPGTAPSGRSPATLADRLEAAAPVTEPDAGAAPPPAPILQTPALAAAVSPPPASAPPPPPPPVTPPPHPHAPAAQLAPAFTLAAAARPGDAQPVVIRLAPTELGHVQVRIERPADAPARVVLAVERPDTLLLLMQDQPQLNRALDAAGVPPDGRTLQFSLGQPDSGQSSGGGGSAAGSNGGWAQSGGFSGDGGRGGDTPRRPPPRTAWLRAGVDITA